MTWRLELVMLVIERRQSVPRLGYDLGRLEQDLNGGLDREIFVPLVEAILIHRFHYGCCSSSDNVLLRVPKKRSKLREGIGVVGYGLHAHQGWCWWKIVVAFMLTQPGPMIFAAWYLHHHPWDMQNAFVPWFVLLGVLATFVIFPDIKGSVGRSN